MTDRIDLEAAAEVLAEMIEQEGVNVDRDALQDMLEELGPDDAEMLLDATDPGGLVDTLEEIEPDLLEWNR